MGVIWNKLLYYLQYPFVIYALIVGILISLVASLLGVTLVIKKYSLLGDGLSHVAFGAMAIAAILHFSDELPFTIVITIISAIFILKKGNNAQLSGDALVAMFSVGSLALGYLGLSLFSTTSNISGDVCTTLFGSTSILTLTLTDVVISVVCSLLIIFIYLINYHQFFALSFDDEHAKASGMNTDRYNLILAVITAVVIVLAMNLVGSLLISALIVFPALSAMRVCTSFRSVTIAASLLSMLCAFSGIVISILAGIPVGPTIVAADMFVYVMVCLWNGGKR